MLPLAGLIEFSALIELIYQGATDFEAWPRVLNTIAASVDASRALIFTPFCQTDSGGFEVTFNLTAEMQALWTTKFQAHDIWALRAFERKLIFTGNVLRDQDLVTDDEFIKSKMSQNFLARYDIGRVMSGVIFSGPDNDNIPVVCSFYRPFPARFGENEVSKLAILLPHISRAMGVLFKLRDAEFKVATSLAALDKLRSGILLFGPDGQVVHVNRAASHILDQKDGLQLSRRIHDGNGASLVAGSRLDQESLSNAINEAVSPDLFEAKHFSKAISVRRSSGKQPFALHFSSLPHANEFGMSRGTPRAIAFLSDSSQPVQLNVQLLQSTYGLTKAEIRTAELIVNGCHNEEIARQLDLSVNTIKTHLRHVFGKTHVANRAGLIKLLLAFVDEN